MLRIGGKVYLTIDQYKQLLHNEFLPVGNGSQLLLRPAVDGHTGESFTELGFELSLDDMPTRELMLAWINAIYDSDESLVIELKQRITEQLIGRQILQQPDEN